MKKSKKNWTESKLEVPKTTVINMKTYTGNDFIRIDRATAFGNPYRIGHNGTREQVIKLYQRYFKQRMKKDEQFYQTVCSLAGCKLGCWCKPLACHGDVIADFLNGIGT